MPCFHPVAGYFRPDGQFVVTAKDHACLRPGCVACGQCIGCRVRLTSDWATRLVHEYRTTDGDAYFVTMTYRDDAYPDDGSCSTRHLQLFHKKWRIALVREPELFGHYSGKLRYAVSYDYSPGLWRAHYHGIYFGPPIPDLYPAGRSSLGELLYGSDWLENLWGHGRVRIGIVSRQSCRYVASHNYMKKTGPEAEEHYFRLNPVTGEFVQLAPPIMLSSRRPGIGGEWFKRFGATDLSGDFIISDGQKLPVPRAYDRKLREEPLVTPASILSETVEELRAWRPPLTKQSIITEKRAERALEPSHIWNNSRERLALREESLRLRMARFDRDCALEFD